MKTIKQVHAAMLMFAFVVTVAGCAAFGLTAPQSFEDKLRYGQSGVNAAYLTIGQVKAEKRITSEVGMGYFEKAEKLEKAFAEVEKLACLAPAPKPPAVPAPCVKDMASAEGKLLVASASLKLLQDELVKAKDAKPKPVSFFNDTFYPLLSLFRIGN